MKRILVDLDEKSVGVLDSLASERKISRARVLREAVSEYVVRHSQTPLGPPKSLDGFGVLKGVFGDGQAYQDRLRGEWD